MRLDDYMRLPYALIIVSDEGGEGYVASYPDLKGCITCAGDASVIVSMAEDAKKDWLEAAITAGQAISLPQEHKAA